MTIEEIKELIQIVNESGIAELEVSRGDSRVRIRRNLAPKSQEIVIPTAPLVAASGHTSVPGTSVTASPSVLTPPSPAAPEASTDNTIYIKSPIVGTYFESPSPGSLPFVKPGDRVSTGQVLCIIESMKLMNEIESELSGTLIAKLVENGKPVEYGEALFAIDPA